MSMDEIIGSYDWWTQRVKGGAMHITDTAIRDLRDTDPSEVVRAVCDLALHGTPIETPEADEDTRDMSREQARRWCAEAIRHRSDDPNAMPPRWTR